MVNRVLLQPSGLKVSGAGVNVLSAVDADLLFNSDFTQAPLYMKGTVTFSSSSILTLNYGKTFVNMPMIMFLVTAQIGPGAYSFYQQYINDWVESGSLTAANAYVRVRNSSFTYYGPRRDGLVMRYIIWDLDL